MTETPHDARQAAYAAQRRAVTAPQLAVNEAARLAREAREAAAEAVARLAAPAPSDGPGV